MSSSTPAAAGSRRLAIGAITGAAALVFSLIPMAPAMAADPPVLDVVAVTPSNPVLGYNGANNTAYTPTNSTGNQGWWLENTITLNLSATDDVGVAFFRVQVGTGQTAVTTDVPATFNAELGKYVATYDLVGNRTATTITYTAYDTEEPAQASAARTISLRQDSVAPVATWPTVEANSWKVPRSWAATALAPTRTDPSPGSGGPAVRALRVDGVDKYLVPVEPVALELGAHTLEVDLGDSAGNGATYSLTFEVTTSYADLLNIIDDFGFQGAITTEADDALTALVGEAQTAEAASDTEGAVAALEEFITLATEVAPQGYRRDALVQDGEFLRNVLLGATPPAVTGGVVVTPGTGSNRYPLTLPTAAPVSHANPDFKVLVFANRPGAFRHEHIPYTEALIMQLAQENNFDADLYDYLSPDDSVANPFETLENMQQYDAIIGVSSVGTSTFVTNRPSVADPAVLVNEQENLQNYIRGGGGFFAIHGATDSMSNWAWYGQLTGGYFHNHGTNQGGIQSTCGGCVVTELITEDRTNPATDQFERSERLVDELYNWNSGLMPVPRELVHVLQTLTESSYDTTVYQNPETRTPYPQNLWGVSNIGNSKEGADHPIAWCQNFEGGRSFTQALMHNWEHNQNPKFIDHIREGILWTSGQTEANCVSHNEVTKILAAASGELSGPDATALTEALTASFTTYKAKNYAAALEGAENFAAAVAASGATGELRSTLEAKAGELVEWMSMLADEAVPFGFVSEPEDIEVYSGRSVTFTSEATGLDLTYQWQSRDSSRGTWADISGATSAELSVVAGSDYADGAQFRVRIAITGQSLNSDPATLSVIVPEVDRIAGANRYEAAVNISKEAFPESAPVVYVATGITYPDALAAGPAAAHEGGPVLLVPGTTIPPSVSAEIARLDPDRIVVVGGPVSVSQSVYNGLAQMAPSIERIAGANRYEVSINIATEVFGSAERAYLATGANFPDALAAGAVAGAQSAPVVLVRGTQSSMGDETTELLESLGVTSLRIAGGPVSVSSGIFEEALSIAPTVRLGGANRYAAARAINADAYTEADRVFLATGLKFPDALAGSVLAALNDAPLYVVRTDCVDAETLQAIGDLKANQITLLGGEASLSSGVANLTACS
ncbi:putative cell wall-binding protein/type 1 glutamine amidotransferase [Microbacteriaceae bacterium SG_E_30_P1]|uniref:Cell wall-binding protein/type 1 glutamine amidotransferase n=1 Tax=Antiquaquibacter oligotrophicus TaxID=2880260 RepID=A0ABT6KPQ5_9MICO|nr:cell wall-binding repeat-containing protein [Antiquaquibacter oligotrophicus]MDH6181781.1 putative cell wall-binding protein/type 1 glutamine amidotransferase [Antiquaquibacter oligotrophicus]UDF12539.1 cell wall-binding repeat-containing protein [Antiquaquibacter oligotrophicus]